MSKKKETAISDVKDTVLSKFNNENKIVIATIEGLSAIEIDEFIKQPADGILYDLNRSEEVVLTFISDPKWINDYAVAKTIRALKDEITRLESELKSKQPKNKF
jgi:hypothetical protein